ncbi:hypothetical protein [uncultured Acetobacteroides sp.]|uniref:hypothetical protein n=1 Tax=uncultured Acetobacteroides sp. TaxID=1760811 RepID=UPI0029F57FCB|nr:hypothetical protein [uncultured Acetobacteroides sp.]
MHTRGGISKISMLIISVAIPFFFPLPVKGQILTEVSPYGSRSTALGSAYVTLTDFWSSLNNPANIARQTNQYTAGVYYENSYLIKELNLSSVGLSYASKHLNAGFFLSRYGITSYNQGNAALIVGKNIWKSISVGGKICYNFIQVADGYGSVAAFTGEFGINAQISNRITLGAHVKNPTHEKIGKEVKETLPSALVLGISYLSPFGITLFSDIDKPLEQKLAFHSGFEWSIYKGLCARAGFRSSPNLLSFGFGYTTNFLTFDISVSKHQTLGYSPQASTTIWFNRKTK